MRNVKVTLAIGIALTVGVLAIVLTRSPPRVVRASAPPENSIIGVDYGEATLCQANETLPAGISAIRFSVVAFFGSQVRVAAYHGSRVLTEGARGADWTGATVTVPVKPVARTIAHVRQCITFTPNTERIVVLGRVTPQREAVVASQVGSLASAKGKPVEPSQVIPLKGRMLIEYLAAGRSSWLSRALSVARHMGIGHFFSGTWVALLVAALMAAVGILTVRLALRELP